MDLASWRAELKRSTTQNLKEWEDDDETALECMLAAGGTLSVTSLQKLKARHGSKPGKRPNIDRDRVQGHNRIWKDYFAEFPVYSDRLFRRRFQMRRHLFLRIHNAVCENDDFFRQKKDAAGLLGLSSIQKMVAALRMLSLGISTDALDEYVRIGESTVMLSLKQFTKSIRVVFSEEYLRQPTQEDLKLNLSANEDRGFPGGNNDLNVLDRSPLVNNFLSRADELTFTVNDRQYGRYYLLADGIYPDWSIFVKTINLPQGDARKWFARCQEGARKDVERAFGVLQQHFAIVRNPVRIHYQHEIKDILLCCIILHNMIVEDEVDDELPADWDFSSRARGSAGRDLGNQDWQEYLAATRAIEDSESHFALRADVIAHLWKLRGQSHRFDYAGNQDI